VPGRSCGLREFGLEVKAVRQLGIAILVIFEFNLITLQRG